MSAVEKVAIALAVPLAVLNLLGGFVSGIWLLFLGKWGVVVGGLLVSFLATKVLAIALAPGLLFGAPAMAAANRGKKAALYFFASLSGLYTIAILTIWCVGVLLYFSGISTDKTAIPLVLWSYGVATAPLTYMVQQESRGGDNFASVLYTVAAQFAFTVTALAVLFGTIDVVTAGEVFAGIMLVALVVQLPLLSRSIASRRAGG